MRRTQSGPEPILTAAFLSLVALGACRGEQATPPDTAAPPAASGTGMPASDPGAASASPPSDSSAHASQGSSAAPPRAASGGGAARTWDFDGQKPGAPPEGFSLARTGGGAAGSWLVKAEPGAPSGANVLAQVDADATDLRFPLAVADDPSARDLRLSVKCKAVSGKVDQACGLVFRYRDEKNYYITRANVLENNVRLYYVKDGRRQQLASWRGAVTGGAWHDLRVEAREDRIQVYWDEDQVLDAKDRTFLEPGRVGVWTKADSVTYFDDLSIEPL